IAARRQGEYRRILRLRRGRRDLADQFASSRIPAGEPVQPRAAPSPQASAQQARDQPSARRYQPRWHDAGTAQDLFQREGQGEARACAGQGQETARQARDREGTRLEPAKAPAAEGPLTALPRIPGREPNRLCRRFIPHRRGGGTMTKKQIFTYVMLVVGFGLAGYLVYNIRREYTVSEIVESVAEIPTGHLVAAL